MSTQQLIESPKGDFTQEKLTHSLFDWTGSTINEKILSLSRWIGTITTETELDEVMKDGLHPFAKFLGDKRKDSAQWKSIIQQFGLMIEKVPSGSATVATAKPWSYLYYLWVRSYSNVISDAATLKTVFDKKITEILEAATDLGDVTNGLNNDSINYFYNNKFETVIISICAKQILATCTKENYALFNHIESFSSGKYNYNPSSSFDTLSLSKLKNNAQEQIVAFIEAQLADEQPKTFADLALLTQIYFNGSNFIDKKIIRQILNLSVAYLDNEITLGKTWIELQEIVKILRVKTLGYYKIEIANSDLQTLRANYATHCKISPGGPQIGLRNLLRQEELLLLGILEAVTPEQLVKIQGQIPVELGHLHNDVMRQADTLIKNL